MSKADHQIAPILVGAEQAAGLLSVSKRHFLSLDSGGKIPASLKLGARRVWSVQTLRAWVEQGCPHRDTMISEGN